MKHNKYVRVIFGGLMLGLLLLLWNVGKSNEMKTMEKIVSTIKLETGHKVSQWQQDKGIALGKPVYAEMKIDYKPANSYGRENVYDELVSTLEKSNWEEDKTNIVPNTYIATLQQHRFELTATVLFSNEENFVTLYLIAH